MTTINANRIAQTVDDLGAYKAQIAAISQIADDAKAALIDIAASLGAGTFVGNEFSARVVFADRVIVDYRSLLADLISEGLIGQEIVERKVRKFTSVATGEPRVTVRPLKA